MAGVFSGTRSTRSTHTSTLGGIAAGTAGVIGDIVLNTVFLRARETEARFHAYVAVTGLLLVLAAAASARHRLAGLRTVAGLAVAAAAGCLAFEVLLLAGTYAAKALTRPQLLWPARLDELLLRGGAGAAVLAAVAAALLARRPAPLVPARRGGPLLGLGAAAAAATASAVAGDSVGLVQHRLLTADVVATVLALLLLAAAATLCRLRLSDALLLLGGTVLLSGAGLLLVVLLASPGGTLNGLKELVPAAVAAALALAVAPVLRRHEPLY